MFSGTKSSRCTSHSGSTEVSQSLALAATSAARPMLTARAPAQNYPQCISLNITNGGTASPAGVGAQQLYSPTDPGIRFNLYTSFTTYPMPGPTVYQARPASRVGTDTPTTLLTAVSTAPRAASSDPAPVVVTATTVVTVLAPGATSAAPPPSSAATAPTSMPAAAPPLPSGVTKADVIAWLTSLILADAR